MFNFSLLIAPFVRFKRRLSHPLVICFFIASLVHAIILISLEAKDITIHQNGISKISSIKQNASLANSLDPFPSPESDSESDTESINPTSTNINVVTMTSTVLPSSIPTESGQEDEYGEESKKDDEKDDEHTEEGKKDDDDDNHNDHDDDDNDDDHDARKNHRRRNGHYQNHKRMLSIQHRHGHGQLHKQVFKRQNSPSPSPPPPSQWPSQESNECSRELDWLDTRIDRHNTECVCLVILQIWTLVLVFMAISYESIPHLISIIILKALNVIFYAISLTQFKDFIDRFNDLADQNICQDFAQNIDNLGPAWKTMYLLDLVSCIIEGVGLIVIFIIICYLRKVFGWHNFRSVGASRKGNRIHFLHLAFQTTLLVGAYFLLVLFALWLHQLCVYGHFEEYSFQQSIGFRTFLGTLCALIPIWIILGWISLSASSKPGMICFILFNLVLIGVGILLCTQQIFCETTIEYTFLLINGIIAALTALVLVPLTALCIRYSKLYLCTFSSTSHIYSHDAKEKFFIVYPADTKPATFPDDNDVVSVKSYAPSSSSLSNSSSSLRNEDARSYRVRSFITDDDLHDLANAEGEGGNSHIITCISPGNNNHNYNNNNNNNGNRSQNPSAYYSDADSLANASVRVARKSTYGTTSNSSTVSTSIAQWLRMPAQITPAPTRSSEHHPPLPRSMWTPTTTTSTDVQTLRNSTLSTPTAPSSETPRPIVGLPSLASAFKRQSNSSSINH